VCLDGCDLVSFALIVAERREKNSEDCRGDERACYQAADGPLEPLIPGRVLPQEVEAHWPEKQKGGYDNPPLLKPASRYLGSRGSASAMGMERGWRLIVLPVGHSRADQQVERAASR
jgi:hypothetical protein